MGRAISESNEAKSKTKHHSDIAQPGFEPRCYRSMANRLPVRPYGGALYVLCISNERVLYKGSIVMIIMKIMMMVMIILVNF